ncbi:uncharacterized protein EV422DRAFT_26151 [Fimicolochytrium jonesii]|uniref:uncharacterized protein n=1 Tax=Fimicolochytrium jonesii TaxID=1396493 RepID=UPI0022FE7B40|nr:uncharacterized protein EV422DRAFT_26151 [Fimicolochytrium jonesii]KAI8827107.1 hypothetical protein EV422DRAFT_26151 [Fimicolochytrium jonesii]
MTESDIAQATLTALRAADWTCTERQIRRTVETALGLKPKALDEASSKKTIKSIVEAFLKDPAAFAEDTPTKRRWGVGSEEGDGSAGKSGSGTEQAKADNAAGVDGGKGKARPKRVVDSDDEDEEEGKSDGGVKDGGSVRKKAAKRANRILDSDDEEEPGGKDSEEAPEEEDEDRDGEETDEKPAKAPRKRTSSTKGEGASKKRKSDPTSRGKGDGEEIKEKDQKAIASLKKYIVQCGVKKKWSTELDGMTGPQQVRHLRRILEDLGVSERPTLEKCKRVKAQREFAAEIQGKSSHGDFACSHHFY